MASRITDDVIDALQYCRLKAYLVLRGEEGVQSAYEKLLIEQRTSLQPKAIEKIRREYRDTEVASDLNLSVANLRKGAALILSAVWRMIAMSYSSMPFERSTARRSSEASAMNR
jgi:hypothetical protein